MSRLLSLLLALVLPVSAALAAVDIPNPASLPEKKSHGDSDPSYPAECARRLLAGKAFLEAGELEKARDEFAKAEKADEGEPWVFFYQAILDYRLGDYPTALQCSNHGIDALRDLFTYGDPDDNTKAQMARFTELRDAIQAKLTATGGKAAPNPLEQKEKFETALQEGDEAYSKGLLAKAAAAYATAFRADRTQGEIGLRAAGLYADRLKNLLEAAVLWQQVIAGGEPHATTARAEFQSHHDALDAILTGGLDRVRSGNQSRSTANGRPMLIDPTEALRLAEAFPDSTELQVAIAIRYAWPGLIGEMLAHLQAAARLGLTPDEFLAHREFVDYLERVGEQDAGAQRFTDFVRDAYGDDTLGQIRTDLKRRADEAVRVAREKAEKERQAKLAAERKELSAWRDARRPEVVVEASRLLGARNGLEVELAPVHPGKKKQPRSTNARSNYFSYENGMYRFTFDLQNVSYRSDASVRNSRISYTARSFASFSTFEVWPSSWEAIPTRNTPGNDSVFYLPVSSAHRELCKGGSLFFMNQADVREERSHVNDNGDTVNDVVPASFVYFQAMLTDGETARLKTLFEKLGRLDAAGNDLEKLRQLRTNWNAWN